MGIMSLKDPENKHAIEPTAELPDYTKAKARPRSPWEKLKGIGAAWPVLMLVLGLLLTLVWVGMLAWGVIKILFAVI